MGRKAAKREIAAADVRAEMDAKGITLLTPDPDGIAEECAQAYKDIEDVMSAQQDLVAPVKRLRSVGVLKG